MRDKSYAFDSLRSLRKARKSTRRFLKNNIESAGKIAAIAVDKIPELRVARIISHVARIEIVGQIKNFQRKSNRVFFRRLKIFGNLSVERKKVRKTLIIGVARADEILILVNNRIRKTGTKF